MSREERLSRGRCIVLAYQMAAKHMRTELALTRKAIEVDAEMLRAEIAALAQELEAAKREIEQLRVARHADPAPPPAARHLLH